MKYAFFVLSFFCFLNVHADADTIDLTAWQHGRNLFKTNCASCHNATVAMTGPALQGVAKRWDDAGSYQGKSGRSWLYAWVRNWSDPVNARYPYAVAMQNYSPSQMNTFPTLTEKEIDDIFLYTDHALAGDRLKSDRSDDRMGSLNIIFLIVMLVLSIGAVIILYKINQKNRQLMS